MLSVASCDYGQDGISVLVLFHIGNGPLTRYGKSHVAHAPGNILSRGRLQRPPLVSDPGIHNGTCVTHVPWCMSVWLTRGGRENVPGIPGACAPANLRIWQEAHEALTLSYILGINSVAFAIQWYVGFSPDACFQNLVSSARNAMALPLLKSLHCSKTLTIQYWL